jgi:threonine dehydrogenase-like Zn-dependent dehydrogenase
MTMHASMPTPILTRALEFSGLHTVTVVDRDLESMGDSDVLVRIKAVGVCYGDIATFDGREGSFPSFGGHEAVGVVEEVGVRVSSVQPGDAVALLGDGRFSELSIAHERDVARIGKTPDDWTRWIAEPLACCVAACDTAQIGNGDNVAVVGCGFMGLGLIQCLAHSMTGPIVAIAPRQASLDRATQQGADAVILAGDPDVVGAANAFAHDRAIPGQHIGPETPSGKFDVVFEASGTEAGLKTASALVRTGGTLVLFGHLRGTIGIDGTSWHMRGLRVINGAPMSSNDFRDQFHRTVALLGAARLRLNTLITHQADFRDAQQLFESSSDPAYVKGVLTF